MVVNKKSLIGILAGITAALLIIALSVYFVFDDGLKGIFDIIINGGNDSDSDIVNNSDVFVNVYALNDTSLIGQGADIKAENVITDFFKLYYGALGELRQNELAQLYTHTSDSRAFDEYIHSYLTELRLNSKVALTYSACEVELTYENFFMASDMIEVDVNVSFSAAFNGLDGVISTMHGQRHSFLLKKKSNKWLIEEHQDNSSTGQYFNNILNSLIERDGFLRNDITLTYITKYINEMKHLLHTDLSCETSEISENKEVSDFEEPYNRDAAVEYALEWADRRNFSHFSSYSDNSMNFVSQCINAGGVLMDTYGLQWKWYTNTLDESENSIVNGTGYSRSWVDANSFYEYAIGNSSYGMLANCVSFTESDRGDIVQFLKTNVDVYGNDVIYTCLVTGIINTELVVTGNSDDIINVPVSVLGYDTARVVKIYGFNTVRLP